MPKRFVCIFNNYAIMFLVALRYINEKSNTNVINLKELFVKASATVFIIQLISLFLFLHSIKQAINPYVLKYVHIATSYVLFYCVYGAIIK